MTLIEKRIDELQLKHRVLISQFWELTYIDEKQEIEMAKSLVDISGELKILQDLIAKSRGEL